MKRSFINFKALSVKQLIVNAAIILMSTIAFQALATEIEEEIATESWMTTPFETEYDDALALENWMTTPFETEYDDALALENWMTTPFETSHGGELDFETCLNRPFKMSADEKCTICP